MFGNKITCKFCGNKIDKKFQFCPHCGKNQSGKAPPEFFQPTFKMGFPFDQLVKHMSKQIERQFKETDMDLGEFKMKENQLPKKIKGISISISSSGNGEPIIKVNNLGGNENIERIEMKEELPKRRLSEAEMEKISKLPKEEPKTNVRRLTDKIVYEISMPGVKKEDVIITKLHNSIEIKAFTKEKAFFKLLPISLPIIKSELKEGKLILELKPKH
jgi:HSP20 family molecular chaperone IbpA